MHTIAKDGWVGLKENWKSDLLAGFLVFLIALPLCLGIALASGVPPLAGILSAVIGGSLVSMISGSYVTINGPAAGLIVVILSAVETLGGADRRVGYQLTLAAIVVAGVIQIVLGLSKAGKLSSFFPASAVHGMLASIGLIIMTKQSYVLLGLAAPPGNALYQMCQLPGSLGQLNPEIAFIGVVSLLTVILLPRFAKFRSIPAPLVAVVVATQLGMFFDLSHEHTYVDFLNHAYHVGPDFLVTLPGNFLDGLTSPDWSRVGELVFWKIALSIAIIASLETLLSAAAVDKLDPQQRRSNLNRDLAAIGLGTTLSGMIGGLPMIAEIVRSSANINNGARTRWSNFFHGLFLLAFVVLAPGLIHHIPLASLAAILIYTGYRLASPKEFARTLKVGSDQFAIFCTTIVVTLASDLLVGMAAGILLKFVLHLQRGASPKAMLRCSYRVDEDGESTTIAFDGPLVFSNLLQLKQRLESVPPGLQVTISLDQTQIVDHSSLEFLHGFQQEYQRSGGCVNLSGLEQHCSSSQHPLATRSRRR